MNLLFFSDSTSLYLYSAFLQANAAIFAVLGVFIVYRMQSHKTSIDIIKSKLYNDNGKWISPQEIAEFESLNSKEKQIKFSNMRKGDYYYKLFETWMYHLNKNNELKSYITVPTIILTVGMVSDAFALLISSNFNKYHQNAEVWLAVILTFYHVCVWTYIAKDLIKVIKHG